MKNKLKDQNITNKITNKITYNSANIPTPQHIKTYDPIFLE